MASDKQKVVNELFNREAENFANAISKQIDNKSYYRGYLFEAFLTKYIKPEDDAIVLDYGCGVGSITKLIYDRGFRIDGYDPSSENIRIASNYNLPPERVRFRLLSDHGESLQDEFYNAIICSSVIEFVEDPDRLLAHFYRSLKPRGILIISFANKRSLWRWYAKIRFKEKPHYQFQYHVTTQSEFKIFLNRAGFKQVGSVRYFDSAFEKWRVTNLLNYLPFIGTLGIVAARRE